jgi:hypothetical protein
MVTAVDPTGVNIFTQPISLAQGILASMPMPIPTPVPTTKAATSIGTTQVVSGGPATTKLIAIAPGTSPSEYTTWDPTAPPGAGLSGQPILAPTGSNPTGGGAPQNTTLTGLVQPPGVYIPNPANVAPTVGAGLTSPTQGNANLNPVATAGTPAVTTMAGDQGGVVLGGVSIPTDYLIGGGMIAVALVITLLATRKKGGA